MIRLSSLVMIRCSSMVMIRFSEVAMIRFSSIAMTSSDDYPRLVPAYVKLWFLWVL